MTDRALSVGAKRRDVEARRAEWECDALVLAGSIQWDKAAQLVGRNPSMPAFLATYVSDAQVRESFHRWCGSALVSAPVDLLMLAAVGIEATSPRYLELPPLIMSVSSDARYAEARPLGRLVYRMGMYEVHELDIDHLAATIEQYGREAVLQMIEGLSSDDLYHLEYAPRRFSQQEVFDIVDGMVRLRDRRQALQMSLAWRVGFAVGFLSSLSIAQPDEAANGMVILAGLVAPLLPEEVSQAGRSPRRIAPVKSKRSGRRSSRKRS
jgi:hypothetical protein